MSSESLLGKQIGNYIVTSHLGQGGMGEVYLAEHPKIQRRVAIKVLAPHLCQHQTLADRFLAEAKAVARIDHPNVIDIYDFGNLDDGRLYYVMELLKGEELQDLIKKKRQLSAAEILPYLEQICAGLQAAHDQRVIHRDLKPENIFILDKKPLQLKILDFGIAKLIETKQGASITSTGMVVGTPLYIAPEQAAARQELISPRTDLYSLGVILYVMLTGRPPFEAEAPPLLMAMHVKEPPPPVREVEPWVPAGIAELVEQCLAKNPVDRPVSASAVASAFEEALRRIPATRELVGPEPPAATAPESPRAIRSRDHVTTLGGAAGELTGSSDALPLQHPRLRWVGLGAATVAVLAFILYLIAGRGEPEPDVPATTVAAAGKNPVSVRQPAPVPSAPRRVKVYTVTVTGPGLHAGARCRLRADGKDGKATPLPCELEVEEGQQAELTVRQRGYAPFVERWKAQGSRSLALALDRRLRKIVLARPDEDPAKAKRPASRARRPGGSRERVSEKRPGASKVPVKEATAIHRPAEKGGEKPAAGADSTAGGKKAEPTRQRDKPGHVGEGTIPLPDD